MNGHPGGILEKQIWIVAEMALARAVGDKVAAAYRRGDLFAKRRHLMQDWADYCLGQVVADPSASQVAAA